MKGWGKRKGVNLKFFAFQFRKMALAAVEKNWAQLDLDAGRAFSASANLRMPPPEALNDRSTAWSRDSTLFTAHWTSSEWAVMEARR